jgi:riboflavin kinase/FMN adenylyltransferase
LFIATLLATNQEIPEINLATMSVVKELPKGYANQGTILTIGVFDGVHLGHLHLIESLKSIGGSLKKPTGIITFTNHPASIVNPQFEPLYLTTLKEKLNLLSDTGVDFVTPISFDDELASLDVEDFIKILVRHMKMVGLVIGPDFKMGKNRLGDVTKLIELGQKYGFLVKVIDSMEQQGRSIRSTAIRELVLQGKVDDLGNFLGRPFSISGTVVHGLERGRKIGYRTANIEQSDGMVTPGDGIYATKAFVKGSSNLASLASTTSIGTRPTFDEGNRTIECHILDFNDDIYGKELRLEFHKRIRSELKFDTVDALLIQMKNDLRQTRALLSESQDHREPR